MKIIMSIKEMAALAGVAKQFDEIINPKDKKRSVQDMITKMINDFKEPEKHGFYSIKMDNEMNLVVECEADAVAKLLGIFKDFVATMYPLYKAAFECGATFGQRIQEVVDEYTEPDKEEDHTHAAVVIVGTKVPKESFEEMFARQQKEIHQASVDMEQRRKEFEKHHAERKAEIDRAVKQMKKKYKKDYRCSNCGRNAKIDPLSKNHICKKCGSEMTQIFQ